MKKAEAEEKAYAAFERERQIKTPVKNKVEERELNAFLTYVAEGEQTHAETLLKQKPELLLHKGTVTDLSKRTFRNITAFQYSLWALDWHMWRMLLRYFPIEVAAQQWLELETEGTPFGTHFDFSPLIDALDIYIRYGASARKMETHWCQKVGGAQLLLPAHVIHEYCRPDRRLYVCPDFTQDIELPRIRKIEGGDWFTAEHYGGSLGKKFAISFFRIRGIPHGECAERVACLGLSSPLHDLSFIRSLSSVRFAQREDLKAELLKYAQSAAPR